MATKWSRLVRFEAEEDGLVHLGELSSAEDVGLALQDSKEVTANLVDGCVFDGVVTDKMMTIAKVSLLLLLSPEGCKLQTCANHDLLIFFRKFSFSRL
jgi:hypothetical protein